MKRISFFADTTSEEGAAEVVEATPAVELTPEQTAQQALENVTNPEVVKESLSTILNYDFNTLMGIVVDGCVTFALKVVAALAIYYVGRWVIGRIIRLIERIFKHKNVDESLRSFLSGIVKVLLYVVVILIIIQVLGINTSSIVAMLASAGLAIGMALSGTLQNFAGGVMILLLRPYRIGDYIDAMGEEGTVKKIGLFSTEVITVDNRSIFIPNSAISSSVIDNYSVAEMRRVDWTVSVPYGTDSEALRKALIDMMRSDKRVVNDPEPVVFLTDMTDGAVKFSARAWTKNCDYWGVKFDINERIYSELPKQGFSFAHPKLNVNILNKQ